MKKLILLFSILFTGLFSSCSQGQVTQEIKVISIEEMDEIMKMDGVQLIDVRQSSEIKETGKIKGAVNIVYSGASWSNKINGLDKSKPVVVYCKSGGRSGRCRKLLQKEGFEKVYDLKGGMQQWKREGKAVVKAY